MTKMFNIPKEIFIFLSGLFFKYRSVYSRPEVPKPVDPLLADMQAAFFKHAKAYGIKRPIIIENEYAFFGIDRKVPLSIYFSGELNAKKIRGNFFEKPDGGFIIRCFDNKGNPC